MVDFSYGACQIIGVAVEVTVSNRLACAMHWIVVLVAF